MILILMSLSQMDEYHILSMVVLSGEKWRVILKKIILQASYICNSRKHLTLQISTRLHDWAESMSVYHVLHQCVGGG